MDLKFTAKSIRNLEKKLGKPLGDIVSKSDLESLNMLVRVGSGDISEEDADVKIDEFLAEGKDTTELLIFILQKLEEQGFLYKKLKISQRVVESLDKKLEEMDRKLSEQNQETSSSQIIG